MKELLKPFFLFCLLTITFYACDDFDDEKIDGNENEYLVEQNLVTSHDQGIINLTINFLATQNPALNEIKDKFTSGVDVYKITYNTTFEGETVVASGLVCVPKTPGDYPLMSFQNGTNTLHDAAPTEAPNSDLFKVLEMMASSGFVIAIPDYLGFGASDDMFHPYLHAESTVQSVTDMLRAVKEFVEEKGTVTLNNDLYITGYSQGGWSTMQLQKAIETQYSGEFNLKASACGAGPYNISTVTEVVTTATEYPMPYFLAYLYNSYAELDMETPMDSVFQEVYADKIPGLFDGNHSGAQINDSLTTVVADLFQPNFVANWKTGATFASLREMLSENSIEGYNTQVPTMLLHGTADTYVPPILSSNLHQQFMDKGVSAELVKLVPLSGLDHTGAIMPAELAAIAWFIQLRDGEL
ncbi:alpha/beta fold hydrolase [Maribellus sp. CM-23]|uniref:alpha/beta hydrolase family protein n=1 Tax=Maribellus sp. CM-23 TaxID=2781026 RepID=UPI001F1F262B|nr:prolyl oligopeptidase family serine peptidase [Maribellus sp. CM-23]MCE4564822.1 alpha/beta fold hydrolase [Maribellus sp. CM-23]